MALLLDISRQFRSIDELAKLVEAIVAAPSTESEPDWLEWKREADLSDRRWQATIAKFIAGFANRDPMVAQRSAKGCAYLVIGAEPENLVGVDPIDNAQLLAGVSRFIGGVARWYPQYIDISGKSVLVIIVEPPNHGDGIVAMITAYQPHNGRSVCRDGDVFVRTHGSTGLAKQADFDMLTQRFAANALQARAMRIEPRDPVTAVAVSCGPDEVDAWLKREGSILLAPMGRRTATRFSTAALLGMENRNEDDYRHQVASYLAKTKPLLQAKARADALVGRDPNMRLTLINETDRNFAAVRVEVSIEGTVAAYSSAEDAEPDLPNPPLQWGELNPLLGIPYIPPFVPPDFHGPYIDNCGSTQIVFDDIDLRPGAVETLEPIYLVADAILAGSTFKASWKATSTSTSGIALAEFAIEVSSKVISPLSD